MDESINYIETDCPKLAKRNKEGRHNLVGKKIHWKICQEEGFGVNEKWYEQVPKPVLENGECKILWCSIPREQFSKRS